MIADENSIPVFTAPNGKASKTNLIGSATMLDSIDAILETLPGCSATTQVKADVPYTPRRVKVFRSAWISAPPELSDPAFVNATGAMRSSPNPLHTLNPIKVAIPTDHLHPVSGLCARSVSTPEPHATVAKVAT